MKSHTAAARLVEVWLMTCDGACAEPYGLYHCDLDMAAMQIGPRIVSPDDARSAVIVLADLGFCAYDDRTQFVWVKQQTNFQLLGGEWRGLKDADWKIQAAVRWYAKLPDNPFLGPFYDLYGAYLRIPSEERREYTRRRAPGESGKGLSSPLEGASKPQDRSDHDLLGERGGVGGREPARSSKRRRPPPADAIAPGFGEWWEIYPLKVGKIPALEAFLVVAPPLDRLMATTRAYIDSEEWAERRDGSRAIPHPATFLNQRRWEDTPTPRRATNARARREAAMTTEKDWRGRCRQRGHGGLCASPTACDLRTQKEAAT